MKKTVLAASLLATLSIAAPASADKSELARDAAAKVCAAERSADAHAFRATYGPEHAMRNCIKATLPEARNAARECAAERSADREAFVAEYGNNENGRNAMGRCVVQKVKDDGAEA